MIPDVYSGVSLEDLKTLKDNKINYGNTTNPIYKDVYNLNNQNIRNYYGISEDDDVSLGTLNNYIALREKQENNNALLKNITGSASPSKAVSQAADKVKNFKYDPNTDPSYKIYVDMYNRQGQSAAKSTLNQLNAPSGGRNNSFSSAATAQVQQAYAQKASEMIPALAEQAYNRLLQNYNIEKDIDDTTYNRNVQNYSLSRNAYTQDLQDEALSENNVYNKWAHGQDYKYAPTEREQGIKMNDVNIETAEITRDNLPRQYDDEHNLSAANLEGKLIDNQYAPKIYQKQLSSSSGGSGGYSSSYRKQSSMATTDRALSQWLYSPYNTDGTGLWKEGYDQNGVHPQYIAVEKIKDANVVNDLIDSLISSGYTYSQAVDKIEEYKTNITIETMKIEGKDGWNDADVVDARKSKLFG